GAVMYEMVTGRPPFEADSPLRLAVKKLRSAPRPPNEYDIELDPRWHATILRCLSPDPAARFNMVPDILEALDGRVPIPKPGRWWPGAAAAALALVLASSTASDSTLRSVRSTIAVLPFADRIGTPDSEAFCRGLSAAVTDQLSTSLPIGASLSVIRAKEVIGSGIRTPAAARTIMGATLIVAGDVDHGAERTRIAVSLSTASPGGLSPVRRIIEVPTTGGGIIQRVATEVA